MLELVERAAGGALLYFLPHILRDRVSETDAIRIAAIFGGATYGLSVMARFFAHRHVVGLRLGAFLMATGTALLLWRAELGVWLSCALCAAGAAYWKTNLLPSYGALGGRSGLLHAAIAGGYLVGIPLFGLAASSLSLVAAIAGTFGFLLAGTAVVPIGESDSTRASLKGMLRPLLLFCALIPLTMLNHIPLVTFTPKAIALAQAHGWNRGTFGTVMLVVAVVVGFLIKSNGRGLVWIAVSLLLSACIALARQPQNVALVLAAHLLFGVADVLLHQFVYPVATSNSDGTTSYFLSVGLGQLLLATTAHLDSTVLVEWLAVFGVTGSAIAYWIRPSLLETSKV